MIESYLIKAGEFIESPLVKFGVLALAIWAGYRFCGWLYRS